MSVAGLTIARAGSKRLPRKNVREFCGLPLLAWTIIQMKAARGLDAVFLSTDDDEMAAIGEKYGAEVIRRPDWPDADDAPGTRPILHALDVIEDEKGGPFDDLAMFFVTAPQRLPGDIDRLIDVYKVLGEPSTFAARRRMTMLAEETVPGWMHRVVIRDKYRRYWDQCSGLGNICKWSWYKVWQRTMPDSDTAMDKMLGVGTYPKNEFGFAEARPWQWWECDVLEEFEMCERFMEHYILQGRGPEIYWEDR